MDIVQHIHDVINRLQQDYPDAKCTYRPWEDVDIGCWIDFEIPKYPRIVIEIENIKGTTLYSAHSVWHGTEYGGSRFGNPKQYPSLDDMLARLSQMVQQYAKAAGGIQASFNWKEE